MQTLESLPFGQLLAAKQFDQLRQLLQQTAEELGALILTEEFLSSSTAFSSTDRALRTERFTLVAAEPFSALLSGKPELAALGKLECGAVNSDRPLIYRISLTFDPDTIAAFLDRFSPSPQTGLAQTIAQARSILQPNHPQVQSQFTLRLIALLTGAAPNAMPDNAPPIAEQSGLAISQAQLYADLQQQKHKLEQRVAKRTQELQDVKRHSLPIGPRVNSWRRSATSYAPRWPASLACLPHFSAGQTIASTIDSAIFCKRFMIAANIC